MLLSGRNYVRIIGLILRNNSGVSDGSGVRIEGAADHIELRNLTIHAIHGQNAILGDHLLRDDSVMPISNLAIRWNDRVRLPGRAKRGAGTQRYVDGFAVTGNTVYDINNIGIVFIGGEGTCPVAARDVATACAAATTSIARCRVRRRIRRRASTWTGEARSRWKTMSSMRTTSASKWGARTMAGSWDSIIVRNNLVYNNDKRGISFGGYNYPSTGLVRLPANS